MWCWAAFWGEIKWGWLHIEGLWVDDAIHQADWGTRLLGAMEQYAQSKDITNYHLETTSFQALPSTRSRATRSFASCPICRWGM